MQIYSFITYIGILYINYIKLIFLRQYHLKAIWYNNNLEGKKTKGRKKIVYVFTLTKWIANSHINESIMTKYCLGLNFLMSEERTINFR